MLTEPSTDSYLPTRKSLLFRLRDCQDHEGWREFFDTYWRVIYRVARQSGLDDATAQDVVQNTFIYLARRMPKFSYDPARGSFKSWLRRVTRSRILVFRRRAEAKAPPCPNCLWKRTTTALYGNPFLIPRATRWTKSGSASGRTI
jgi:RNA polymerase sigma-70 factor (ECF subfamily)